MTAAEALRLLKLAEEPLLMLHEAHGHCPGHAGCPTCDAWHLVFRTRRDMERPGYDASPTAREEI